MRCQDYLCNNGRLVLRNDDGSIYSEGPCSYCNTTIPTAELEALRAKAEAGEELQQLFDLQWKRMGEATAAWREANPGNDLVCPDLGKLLTWLLARIKAGEMDTARLDWLEHDMIRGSIFRQVVEITRQSIDAAMRKSNAK